MKSQIPSEKRCRAARKRKKKCSSTSCTLAKTYIQSPAVCTSLRRYKAYAAPDLLNFSQSSDYSESENNWNART